jgi:protein transport protein SEC23
MKKLPQLVYHLRRSHFVNRFGISLDESYYIGYMLNRESIVNTISMIQPALLKYSL